MGKNRPRGVIGNHEQRLVPFTWDNQLLPRISVRCFLPRQVVLGGFGMKGGMNKAHRCSRCRRRHGRQACGEIVGDGLAVLCGGEGGKMKISKRLGEAVVTSGVKRGSGRENGLREAGVEVRDRNVREARVRKEVRTRRVAMCVVSTSSVREVC